MTTRSEGLWVFDTLWGVPGILEVCEKGRSLLRFIKARHAGFSTG